MRNLSILLLAASLLGAVPAQAGDQWAGLRAGMVREIEEDVRATRGYIGREALSPEVMAAMGRVPRHEFVPAARQSSAYENRPLPIGFGQTISQPYIVALMTDLLTVGRGGSVLEVGTGSGYQAAVLADMGIRVWSVEIIPELAERARGTLERVGYGNVAVRAADGYFGWEEHAPYDGIIVTAAAGHVPQPLVRQLRPGGKMIIPVGMPFMAQDLILVEKDDDGSLRTRHVLPVSFVPLTGGH